MSLESLTVDDYSHLLLEDDSDEELLGEKCYSVLASLLDNKAEGEQVLGNDHPRLLPDAGKEGEKEKYQESTKNYLFFDANLSASANNSNSPSINDDDDDEPSILILDSMEITGAPSLLHQNAKVQRQQQPLIYPQQCSSSTGAPAHPCDDPSSLPPPPPQLQGVAAATSEVVTVQCRPKVPPKPQIDLVRYSMANVNKDDDLDAILNELYDLERQLSSDEGSNKLLLGIPSLPQASSTQPVPPLETTTNLSLSTATATITPLTTTQVKAELNNSVVHISPDEPLLPRVNTDFCASPDVDSAFGDSSSTDCSSNDVHRYRHSEISSGDSYRGSVTTPSPSHPSSPKSACVSTTDGQPTTPTDLKAQKIKEALEKMKEAKMKKIYVKIFLEDGNVKGLLIDERWTVLETMKQLAAKLNIVLTPEHSIVEEYPDLYIKRIYEDHEFVVENIEDWLADSKNKLHFLRRPDKFAFIYHPQHYLLNEKSDFDLPSADSKEWTPDKQQRLIQRSIDSAQVPELDGHLYLKLDGKKTWKKFYFCLRSSGLYYCPKARMRGTKDLQCLMNIYNCQIYTSLGWKKKYKAPTEFGFAIKHPKIQVKHSKYIKYVCTEDEKTYIKWLAALRITRNTFAQLHDNFKDFDKLLPAVSSPIRVSVPMVSTERLSAFMSNQQNVYSSRPASAVNGYNAPRSPARISMSSRTSDNCSTSSGHPYDQEDSGTIKRMPCDLAEAATCAMRRVALANANNVVAQTYMLRHSTSSSSQNSVKPISIGDDDDSDEEHLPPPPEAVLQRTPTPQQPMSHRSSFASPIPPPLSQKPEILSVIPQNQAVYMTGGSPVSNGSARKIPPPPPPKRAETTRLVTAPGPPADLYSELRKATAQQKRRIEGN